MSALVGIFGSAGAVADDQLSAMLRRMETRGSDRVQTWRSDDVVLVVARHDWELEQGFSGPVLIAEDEQYVVAADASVYYRGELRRALAATGVVPGADTPAHLILAAFHAWGPDCVHHIDGDFAFITWDRRNREAVCARDFGGKRPLHYARVGRELVVASTIGGVAAYERCSTDLNLPILAASASGLVFSAGPETCYKAVQVLPHAHHLAWRDGRITGPTRYWDPPVDGRPSRLGHEEGALHLRELLVTAAHERMQPAGVNTVWMSGGWDSTSVFGAAQHAAGRAGVGTRVLPVSISYPQGDPGREDDWIEAVADRWQVPVHWIDIADIPFLDREPERAAARDEPYAHLYERWNSALARGTRACGSRIALDGNGGDQLFQNSDVFLADLLRSGRWLTLAREWPARRRGGYREFFATVIQPNLSPRLLGLAARMRGGRRLKHYLERGIPEWLDPDFVARHGLIERDMDALTRPLPVSNVGREIDWLFTCLFVSRAFSLLGGFSLANGVELRSPLSDRRVIDFALSRPWWERSSGRETKRLLRRSMAGLLPDDVLAPRSHRTGITGGYSHRWMSEVFPAILEQTMTEPMMLEELGVIRPDALRRACAAYPRRGDASTRVALFYTLQTELWLRAHHGGSNAPGRDTAGMKRDRAVVSTR